MSQQAAYHAEQLEIQHDIERVIEEGAARPLTQDEQALLRWATGTSTKGNEHGKY